MTRDAKPVNGTILDDQVIAELDAAEIETTTAYGEAERPLAGAPRSGRERALAARLVARLEAAVAGRPPWLRPTLERAARDLRARYLHLPKAA